jgi:predicted extracellular nuclease
MSLAWILRVCASSLLVASVWAQSIQEINGNAFISPYNGQAVTGVIGVVTARKADGFFLRALTGDVDPLTSKGIFVFTRNVNITVGSTITLDGRVTEFRSNPAYLPLVEITSPTNVQVVSTGVEVVPVEIGAKGLDPPTEQLSALDGGDVFALPNNQSLVSAVNPPLDPDSYGLDFMESLLGQLVTIRAPIAVAKPNSFGDTWVVGQWRKTGINGRGGLTLTEGDVNPEAILIGEPLDGSANPRSTKLGDSLGDITGVVYQAFGFYRVLPTTAIVVTGSKEPVLPHPVAFESTGSCSAITVGQYNVENLEPESAHLPDIAAHIVDYLKTPDVIFLQEIQDNTGAENDGVVSASETLTALSNAVAALSGVQYSYIEIVPVNNADGGAPGGNIRVAYLYNPTVVALHKPNPGAPTDAVSVLPGPELSFNPGRIAPADAAWTASRKPLVAQWDVLDGNSTFFTVNVHFGSKGGSSSIQGDARPPVNGGVGDRLAQAELTAGLLAEILAQDPEANIVAAGDFNEFAFVEPMKRFVEVSGLLDLDVVAGIPETERYSYIFDMNCQELDHMYISPRIARKRPSYEHVHVNTWVAFADQISDHDPAVAVMDLCGARASASSSSSVATSTSSSMTSTQTASNSFSVTSSSFFAATISSSFTSSASRSSVTRVASSFTTSDRSRNGMSHSTSLKPLASASKVRYPERSSSLVQLEASKTMSSDRASYSKTGCRRRHLVR